MKKWKKCKQNAWKKCKTKYPKNLFVLKISKSIFGGAGRGSGAGAGAGGGGA